MQPAIQRILKLSPDVRYVAIYHQGIFEFVASIEEGRLSVGLEPSANPLILAPQIMAAASGLVSGSAGI